MPSGDDQVRISGGLITSGCLCIVAAPAGIALVRLATIAVTPHDSTLASVVDAAQWPFLAGAVLLLTFMGMKSAAAIDRARNDPARLAGAYGRLALVSRFAVLALGLDLELRVLSAVVAGRLQAWMTVYPILMVILLSWFSSQMFALVLDALRARRLPSGPPR